MITELEGINKQWGRGGGCELEAGALGGDEEDEARPPTFRVHKRWDFPGRASSGSPTQRWQVGEKRARLSSSCHVCDTTEASSHFILQNHNWQELFSPFTDETTEGQRRRNDLFKVAPPIR